MVQLISHNPAHHESCYPLTTKMKQQWKTHTGVKRKATEDRSDTPDTVVTKKLRQCQDKDNLGTKDLKNLKQTVYRERNKDIPHKLLTK